MNYFILVCADSENAAGEPISAHALATQRLKQRKWPLYRNTRNRRHVSPGDQCLFYIGGKKENRQSIIGRAVVVSVEPWSHSKRSVDLPSFLDESPASVVHIENIDFFTSPLHILPLLDRLLLTARMMPRWGSALQGGCVRIQQCDFEILAPPS